MSLAEVEFAHRVARRAECNTPLSAVAAPTTQWARGSKARASSAHRRGQTRVCVVKSFNLRVLRLLLSASHPSPPVHSIRTRLLEPVCLALLLFAHRYSHSRCCIPHRHTSRLCSLSGRVARELALSARSLAIELPSRLSSASLRIPTIQDAKQSRHHRQAVFAVGLLLQDSSDIFNSQSVSIHRKWYRASTKPEAGQRLSSGQEAQKGYVAVTSSSQDSTSGDAATKRGQVRQSGVPKSAGQRCRPRLQSAPVLFTYLSPIQLAFHR